MMQIDDTLHLSRMLLNHYLFCICECQLRGCNIALDPNIGRCFELFHFLTHSSLLLQSSILLRMEMSFLAQPYEHLGILVLKSSLCDCGHKFQLSLSFLLTDVIGRLSGSSTRSKGGAFIGEFFDPSLGNQL